NDAAALVQDKTNALRLQALGIGRPADGNNQAVELQGLWFVRTVRIPVPHQYAAFAGSDLVDLHAEVELEPLFREGLECLLGDLFVGKAQEGGQCLEQ